MNRFGRLFTFTTFGESHGPAMGAVIDGCPAGVIWKQELLDQFLERRRPGKSNLTSGRQEHDRVEILSGVFDGKTLGTPIAAVIRNADARSEDYRPEALATRPGHATDLWQEKYGHSDPRGSGRASGRETVSRVIAGAVARMLVEQLHPEIRVLGFVEKIGPVEISSEERDVVLRTYENNPSRVDEFSLRCPVPQKNQAMEDLLRAAKENGESYGGVAAIRLLHVPRGLGEPVFYKLKSTLSSAFMSIGATMGFEIGAGFASGEASGAEFHSPEAGVDNYGGLRGGITTGEPIALRIAFKPTSSRREMALKGRHDPCIVPRAVPVLEAMAWTVLADQLLLNRTNKA